MKIGVLKIIHSVLILLTFGFQCDEVYVKPVYELELPYKVFPVKKEYHINDTIQISAIIKDRSLKDLYSQNLVELKCADIRVWFYAGVRIENYNLLTSDNVFEAIVDTLNFPNYQIENNGQFSKFEAQMADSIFYKEEIAILKLIPKKKGIFMLEPYDSIIRINKAENCDTIYPIIDLGEMNHIFDIANTNPELLEESPLPHNTFISGDHVPRETAEKRIFWFKVIE